MADVGDNRQNITEEETDFRSAVSEATAKKQGGAINFINNKQYEPKEFKVNGYYSGANLNGIDGLQVFQFDTELVGITLFNVTAGSSGSIEFDLHRLTSDGSTVTDEGSIFSVTPKISYLAGDDAYFNRDLLNATTLGLTSNVTIPVTTRTTFAAGDAARVDFIGGQQGGENAGMILHFRPINASDVEP